LLYTEKDCFEKSQNYCSRGERRAELNIHLEDTVSTKTVRRELHESNIHGRAAIAKPLITESNAQMRKRWCSVTTIKPGRQATGNARAIWSDESSFTLLPTSERLYVWRTPREAYNPESLVPTVKHRGGVELIFMFSV
jgi:hypothetical protein